MVPARAAAVVVGNSSFENPTVGASGYIYNPTGTAWTFTNSSGIAGNGGPFYAGSAPDGTQAAFIQSNVNTGISSISQTITGLTIGMAYQVAFYIASRPGTFGSTPVNVMFGSSNLGSYTNTGTSFVAQNSSTYVASATSAVLKFTATNVVGGDNDVALDAVSVVSVPEPASLALLAVGTLGVVLGRRRHT